MQYNFEWDPLKAKTNLGKHKVGFEQAIEVFVDPMQLNLFDDDHSEDEERWITLGQCKSGDCLVVVHTFEEYDDSATIRIISARKATNHERQAYEDKR